MYNKAISPPAIPVDQSLLIPEAPGCLKNICLIIPIIFPSRELSLINFAMTPLLASFNMSQGEDSEKHEFFSAWACKIVSRQMHLLVMVETICTA